MVGIYFNFYIFLLHDMDTWLQHVRGTACHRLSEMHRPCNCSCACTGACFFIDFLNVTIAFFLFEWCFNMVAFVLQGILYQILEG